MVSILDLTEHQLQKPFSESSTIPVLWYGPAEDEWWLPTGCLEQLEGVVNFTQHIYIQDTVDSGCSDWILKHRGETLKRFSTRSTGNTLAPRWVEPQQTTARNSTDRLHAHCSCGAINIYIARPDPVSQSTIPPSVPTNSGPPNHHENETWWLMADKQKYLAVTCACTSCRLAFGFELIEWAFIPTVNISLDPEGKVPFSRISDKLSYYHSSDCVTRYFCNGCGASVFWDGDTRPGLIDVAVGLLDAPEGSRAESWLEWKSEYVCFRGDSIPRATNLIASVEEDMRQWGHDVQGRDRCHQGFHNAYPGNIVGSGRYWGTMKG